jgi:alpha-2-macroglobulin
MSRPPVLNLGLRSARPLPGRRLLIGATALLGGLGGLPTVAAQRAEVQPDLGRPAISIRADLPAGLLLVDMPDASASKQKTVVTPLSAQATAALLRRLEPLPDLSVGNAKAPSLRPPSAAPPANKDVRAIPFVVPTGRPVAEAPLRPGRRAHEVLPPPDISPEGLALRESEVRIRFSEAMVPVAQLGVVKQPPVRLTPAVPGTWRWLDTQVLVFTASTRLPGATEFVVTVPAGTRALSQAKLAENVLGQFCTSPVDLVDRFPSSEIRPDSPILLGFDQAIDADRIAPFLQMQDAEGRDLPWRSVSLAEAKQVWKQNPSVGFEDDKDPNTLSELLGKPHVILAPTGAWPAGGRIAAVLKSGAPSREGPRLTTRADSIRFDVVAPFMLLGVACDYGARVSLTRARCPAGDRLMVQFSNRIDPQSFRADKLQIEGEPFEDHSPSGGSVWVLAPRVVGRRYSIAVGDDLMDAFGQPLTGDRRLSFTTGPLRHEAGLEASAGLQVLDPRYQIPQWLVFAHAMASVRVQLYRVEPRDYFAYQVFEEKHRATPPGRLLFDRQYAIGARQGAEIRVDLRPALNSSGLGHVIAVATPSVANNSDPDGRQVAWIQVSKLGISARLDREKLRGWVHDIRPDHLFAPVAGAKVSLQIERRPEVKVEARSDGEGQVGFELPPPEKSSKTRRSNDALLVARTRDDSTFVAVANAERAIRKEEALWFVTDDRFLYKPDETVYLKGWLRWTHDGVNPGLALPAAGEAVTYTLSDARGIKIASGTSKTSEQGGFDLEVKLPPNVNLGHASFRLASRKSTHVHPIAVQEFRTPAYAVSLNDDVTHAGTVPLILGESIEMNASAKYYAGGGLEGAGIVWRATLSRASYSPPGWPLYSFAPPENDRREPSVPMDRSGVLDGASSAGVSLGIAALPGGLPSVLEVDATVTDLDRMSIRGSSRPILVHPSAYYVGMRFKKGQGQADLLELVVTDIDGLAVPGVPIDVTFDGVLASESYRDDAKVIDTQICKRTSTSAPVICPWKPVNSTTAYTATARVKDARSRGNCTRGRLPWYSSEDQAADFQLVPDKRWYAVGDTARIEIRSRVLPATAVVSFARQGIIEQKRIQLSQSSTVVSVPIEPGFMQNLFVVVDGYGPQHEREGKGRPPLPKHTALGLNLPINIESARLVMTARSTEPLVEPGAPATFEVTVEHDGKPMADAEVALLVVDEAILALAGRSHADPLAPFYREVGDGTTHHTSIDWVRDAGNDLDGQPGIDRYRLDERLWLHGTGTGGGGLGYGRAANSASIHEGEAKFVTARKDFRANAVFSPKLKTDARGRVRLTVTMPDNLTRFRIVALASAGPYHFGKAESVIVTRRKLNARTIAPRFLSQGDRFSLPVLVQNLDPRPRTVDVAVRAANLSAIGPAGQRVIVPGGGRAEVRFDFATQARGQAMVQTIAASGDLADASNVTFPVYEPATTESFATYGTVGDGEGKAFEQLVVPADVFQDVGGVTVSLASTELQSLTDAFWYLQSYPYECAEQRSARMLATAAVYDILDAFATPGRPTRKEIDAIRASDLRVLSKDQRPDGGWGYFRGMRSDPFVTMQVVQALAAQGQVAPLGVIAKANKDVRNQIQARFAELAAVSRQTAAWQSGRGQLAYAVSLAALGLSTLAATGEDVGARAERLHAQATKLGEYPMDAKARLLALVAGHNGHKAMRAQLMGEIVSATHETAAAATVTTSFREAERLLLVSNPKTTALALDALLRESPEHPLLPKLARGLLAGRRHGGWSTTQENLVAVQALRRYFDRFEKAVPNYIGKLWVGQAGYAEQSFVGRSPVQGLVSLDFASLVPGSTHDLALLKQGTGRLYYRVGVSYAPKDPHLPALDAGFVVRRSYSAVDDPRDVSKLPDGRWRIRLGAKILVTVEASNTSTRHNVALVDPLPAGFETVNQALITAERAESDAADSRWNYRNLRDNRSEAFALVLDEGSHRFSYTVRATTPGTFIAAPAKAEEMYSPETFGRSTGEVVEIAEP